MINGISLRIAKRVLEAILITQVELSGEVTEEAAKVSRNDATIDEAGIVDVVLGPGVLEVAVHPLLLCFTFQLESSRDELLGSAFAIKTGQDLAVGVSISRLTLRGEVFDDLMHKVIVVGTSVVVEHFVDLLVLRIA